MFPCGDLLPVRESFTAALAAQPKIFAPSRARAKRCIAPAGRLLGFGSRRWFWFGQALALGPLVLVGANFGQRHSAPGERRQTVHTPSAVHCQVPQTYYHFPGWQVGSLSATSRDRGRVRATSPVVLTATMPPGATPQPTGSLPTRLQLPIRRIGLRVGHIRSANLGVVATPAVTGRNFRRIP